MSWDGDNFSDHLKMPEKRNTSSYSHAVEIARPQKVAKQGHYQEHWEGKKGYSSTQIGEAWGYHKTPQYHEQANRTSPPDDTSKDDAPDPDLEALAKVEFAMHHI